MRNLSPEAAALERMVGHQPGHGGAAMLEAAVRGGMTAEMWADLEARWESQRARSMPPPPPFNPPLPGDLAPWAGPFLLGVLLSSAVTTAGILIFR